MTILYSLAASLLLSGFLFLVSLFIFYLTYIPTLIYNKLRAGKDNQRIRLLLKGFLGGLPLGFVGMVAGFLTGLSRAPAVSALVPAILTFIGFLVVYLIGKNYLRSVIAGFVVFIFSCNLLVGAFLGTSSRDRQDEILESLASLKRQAEKEYAIRIYREALGLPPEVPRAPPIVAPAESRR